MFVQNMYFSVDTSKTACNHKESDIKGAWAQFVFVTNIVLKYLSNSYTFNPDLSHLCCLRPKSPDYFGSIQKFVSIRTQPTTLL